MQKPFYVFALGTILASALTACVDDNYDLENIDTTVRVNVKDLVVPVNIDEITLSDIIKLEDQESVEIIDGQYNIVQNGEFTSDPVIVNRIHLTAPYIEPTYDEISLAASEMPVNRAGMSYTFDISSSQSEFAYTSTLVSDFIVSIDYIGCELSLTTNFTLQGLENIVRRISFTDVEIQFPKGLNIITEAGDSYDPKTGIMKIADRTVAGNTLSLTFRSSGIDFATAEADYNYDTSILTVNGSFFISSGKATIAAADITSAGSMPTKVTLATFYALSDADVTSFSGELKYLIDQASLTDVDLSDLPDVLAQQGTNLIFANPCIYLKLTNPLQPYNLYAETGLAITAYRGENAETYSIDNGTFNIGRPAHADGIYNYCLSPEMPANVDPDYSGAEHVPFTSLSRVLSGDGIPPRLGINVSDPNIPTQKVTDFLLGQELGALNGTYKFVAPLQFLDGTQIEYTDKIDGWYSEDIEYLVITDLEINLNVTTDIPVDIDFTGYPIDINGNQINKVSIEGAKIQANSKNAPVKIRITGEIRNLDGIEFVAKASAASEDALTPDMTIKLSQIRPKASGYYEKEL